MDGEERLKGWIKDVIANLKDNEIDMKTRGYIL